MYILLLLLNVCTIVHATNSWYMRVNTQFKIGTEKKMLTSIFIDVLTTTLIYSWINDSHVQLALLNKQCYTQYYIRHLSTNK